MKIEKDTVGYVADLSKLELNDSESEKMTVELAEILGYMDRLNSVNTEGVEPMSHIFAIKNVMRKDIVQPSYDRKELLKNAPKHKDDTVIVPKTFD